MIIKVSVWSCLCVPAPFLRVMIAQATTTTRTPIGPTTWLISERPSTLLAFQSQEGLGLVLGKVFPACQGIRQ